MSFSTSTLQDGGGSRGDVGRALTVGCTQSVQSKHEEALSAALATTAAAAATSAAATSRY